MKLPKDLIDRLSGFFNAYRQKVDFLKALYELRKGADEIVLLACCYIDQLAGCLFPQRETAKNFYRMLLTHSGESDEFRRISVPDLAFHILWMAESASYTIPKPGRIQLQSEELKPLIRFLDQTGVPLTERSTRDLFLSVGAALKKEFRIFSPQTGKKESHGGENAVVDVFLRASELQKIREGTRGETVKSLLDEYTYGAILYREYRCKSVHEASGVHLDSQRFWRQNRPYYSELEAYWLHQPILRLEFPSAFLIQCVETCTDCAEKAILGKGLLPPAIWGEICDLDEVQFLDTEAIEEARAIKLRID